MDSIYSSPKNAAAVGGLIALVMGLIWLGYSGAEWFDVISFLIRWVHVLAGIVWVGLVFFVNYIQLVAMYEVDAMERGFIMRVIGARTAWWFRQASHLSVLSGLLLLVMTGYLLPSLFYGDSGVFWPVARLVMIWSGVVGGLTMWVFVHMFIWPNLQVMSGARPGDDDARARARIKVRNYARANLILSIPVVLAMMGVAHL